MTEALSEGLPLNQIAFSVTDLVRTHRWYQDVFGYVPAGGTDMFRGRISAHVQGVKGVASSCWWLVDKQDFFQLELFEVERPEVRPLPPGWRPCDIGYTTVGLHVADFDATLQRLNERRTPPLTEPAGPSGSRRVCVRDPEGVLLEVMEDDPRGPWRRPRPRSDVPVVTRFVTVSVPDLESARRTWIDALGLSPATGVRLHGPEHEMLWGLDGARRETMLLWAGDVLVEVVQYLHPVGRPWPQDYRITDQGLLNIAFGFRDRRQLEEVRRRCESLGIHGNWRVFSFAGLWAVVYVNDPMGFSVELLHVRPWRRRLPVHINAIELGFEPAPPPRRRRQLIRRFRRGWGRTPSIPWRWQ
jgi:catechol 2,3-dioxygenase-like lactoylglutathione lyase family enzyme